MKMPHYGYPGGVCRLRIFFLFFCFWLLPVLEWPDKQVHKFVLVYACIGSGDMWDRDRFL